MGFLSLLFLEFFLFSGNKTVSTVTKYLSKTWASFLDSLSGVFSPKNVAMAINGIVVSLVIFLLAWILHKIISFIINRWIFSEGKHLDSVNSQRVSTVGSLFLNFSRYALILIALMLSLQAFNVNLAAIIAGAGVVGLAIGFGAQTLVRDLISGIFIILEGDIAVGDEIEYNGQIGQVEYIGIRVTKMRRFNGELRIIPNGELGNFGNMNRGYMRALVIFSIPVRYNLPDVLNRIQTLADHFSEQHQEKILEQPFVQAITQIGSSGADLRAVFKCKPGMQYEIERDFRLMVLADFASSHIEVGVPQQQVVVRNESGR